MLSIKKDFLNVLVRNHQSYSVTIYIVSEPEATNVLMPCGNGRIIAYKKEFAVRRVNNYIY